MGAGRIRASGVRILYVIVVQARRPNITKIAITQALVVGTDILRWLPVNGVGRCRSVLDRSATIVEVITCKGRYLGAFVFTGVLKKLGS